MEQIDFTKCRLCLENAEDGEMFDLFPKIYEKVEHCCGVRIRQSSEMPSRICLKCFDMTRIWFNFRQMCLNSQVYLESLCKDRERPVEFQNDDYDESAYLEYLLQELQTTRLDTVCVKTEDDVNDSPEYDDDNAQLQFEHEMSLDEVGTDTEFENIIQNTNSVKNSDSEIDTLDTLETEEESKPQKTATSSSLKRKSNFTVQRKFQKKMVPIPTKALRPPSPNTYMCSVCGNVYTKKASFTYHMGLHSNVKPHECEICGKAFRQVSELKNHMRRHTGEKPYKCNYCDRHFIDRSEKHRHERVHTNTRPYVCNICGKSFAYSTILKNHSKTHSVEKDFNCLVCNKSFSLQHQLKAHLQTLTHKQKETQFVDAGYEVLYE